MTKTVSKMTATDETDTLSAFIAASRDNDLDLIEKMIESNKSLVNTADEEKRTALHWAVDRGHIGIWVTFTLSFVARKFSLEILRSCVIIRFYNRNHN